MSKTLSAALGTANAAGITRLANISALDPIGLPVFQAVRPTSRSLSVAMGKGAVPRAAQVSALMEAIEVDAAERAAPTWTNRSLDSFGLEATNLWCGATRDRLAIQLSIATSRAWVAGFDLASGAERPLPLDLVTLDFTLPAQADCLQSSAGLASGNSREEALVTAVGELIEHDLAALWQQQPALAKRGCEVDPGSIDDALVRCVLARIAVSGRQVRLWSIGQDFAVAAFECVILDMQRTDTALPPVRGAACHPQRTVAALGAILEAVQSRAAMISGARDDLARESYCNAARRSFELLMTTLSFGGAPLTWDRVPDRPHSAPEDNLHMLLDVVAVRSPLPVLAVELPQPHPDLHVVRALAPGLIDSDRATRQCAPSLPACWTRQTARPARGRRILFAGPSLAGAKLDSAIELRPPASAGDLAALLDDPPEAVGLIDGFFETAPSVWHKEILDLLAHGVAVLGGASLGALRAAELHGHGMRGIGTIFGAYRAGLIRRDDAVMIVHAPAELGYRALTVALVDAEAALGASRLPAADRRMLQRIARTLPFRKRTWAALLDGFEQRTGRCAPVTIAELSALPSLKRADADALVAALAGPIAPPPAVPPPPFTSFYRALLADMQAQAASIPSSTSRR